MKSDGSRNTLFGLSLGIAITLLLFLVLLAMWTHHVRNLATVEKQKRIIAAYEMQRNELRQTLQTFDFQKGALLDHDTPVASIVDRLDVIEFELARARERKAAAYKKIAATKLGPMSGVLSWVGDD